ncbi:uncharacterized protein N7515_002853 [Penicillium bovifimosum]|uniref:Uncharacterized protein n=1 Tax=Penicillium bovifimosum TaxID=126998 RepID=A0A9W9HE54_9EURO|nr:uncharacterized protein N7515_002853 [Penicillium bovifimosum]KAJ5144066.1 hypothetical protein N7515_002853 [Penicillium bovifimosum]
MSSSNTHPHISPAIPASSSSAGPTAHTDPDQRRNSTLSTDSDVIHFLYFEDNDGFFPPSWIGKQSQQVLSDKGTSSHGSGGEAKSMNASKFEGHT